MIYFVKKLFALTVFLKGASSKAWSAIIVVLDFHLSLYLVSRSSVKLNMAINSSYFSVCQVCWRIWLHSNTKSLVDFFKLFLVCP